MQWFWLILITTLVAGACIWIVSWGDKDETPADAAAVNSLAPVDDKQADA
jgi:hypothetical protein